MVRKRYILIFIVTFFSLFNSMHAVSYDPKGILFFIDDFENDLGAISQIFLIALMQNAGPIIASTSLLMTIENKYPAHYLSEIFDTSKWVMKNINNLLVLLIPHQYIDDKKLSIADVELYDPKIALTDVELKLGLKVNHMKLMRMNDLTSMYLAGDRLKNKDYFIKALEGDVTSGSLIFCMRTDYFKKDAAIPVWSIYITGHGQLHNLVIGISLDDFKKSLDFLNTRINVRFLMYVSCYSAGLQNELIYKDQESAAAKTYAFPIVIQAITEANTTLIIRDINGKLKPDQLIRFDEFLKSAINPDVIDFKKTVNTVSSLVPYDYSKTIPADWANIPQLRLPGLEWFSILASPKEIVSIGSILAKSRQMPLNINNFFKTDPKALLLYASHIPFELVINSNNMRAIISMIPGDVVHYIRKILSVNHSAELPYVWQRLFKRNVTDIMDWFMQIDSLAVNKIFYIEELNKLKNVIINNIKIPGDPDKDIDDKYERYALFYDRTILYIKQFGKAAVPADESRKQLHQTLLSKVQKEKSQPDSLISQDDVQKIAKIVTNAEKRAAAKKRIDEALEKIEKQKEMVMQQKNMQMILQALKNTEQKLYELSKSIYLLNKE